MSEQFTPERLAELRRIAEAATPGPWENAHGRVYAQRDEHSRMSLQVGFSPKCDTFWRNEADGDYIATFDPPTALAMLGEIERLRRERDHWQTRVGELGEEVERLKGWRKHDLDNLSKATTNLHRTENELERLRREREVLAAAVRAREDARRAAISPYRPSSEPVSETLRLERLHSEACKRDEAAHQKALALLDGEKGGGGA